MLSKAAIESYLIQLSSELEKQGKKGEIILCGGAVMTLLYGSRGMTQDIDAVFTPTKEIRDFAVTVSQTDNLESDWLNDGAKGFIDTTRMHFNVYKDFPGLTVKVPDTNAMLAMKLASARPKSIEDVYAILEQNIPPARLTATVDFLRRSYFKNISQAANAISKTSNLLRLSLNRNFEILLNSLNRKIIRRIVNLLVRFPSQFGQSRRKCPSLRKSSGLFQQCP